MAQEHEGEVEQARRLYERLARLAEEGGEQREWSVPGGGLRWALAGGGMKGLGRGEEAEEMLEKALRIEPAQHLARQLLAQLKSRQRVSATP